MSARHRESDGEGTVPFPPAAGFWRRVAAWFLDLVWIAPAAWFSAPWLRSRLPTASWLGLAAGILLLLLAAMWRLWGATPGKVVLGLRIVGADGLPLGGRQVVARCVGYLLSVLTLGLGFAMVGLNASRRGLHDQLSETYVAEVRRGRRGKRGRRRRQAAEPRLGDGG